MAIFDAHAEDRLQVFIDGKNLFGTLKAIDKKIDYKAFIETLREETRFIRAQYYTTVHQHQWEDERFRSVLNLISENGYTLRTKDVRDSMDSYGNIRTKGTMIGEMTAGMIDAADNGTDHIVLMSGDGELAAAVAACKYRDVRVTVVSSARTRVISDELRYACDQFIDIETLPPRVLGPDLRY